MDSLECGGPPPLSPTARPNGQSPSSADKTAGTRWHHAPVQRLSEGGVYIVTAGTYLKFHIFRTPARKDLLVQSLHACASEFGWELQAWAVFSNHYHFVGLALEDAHNLPRFLSKLHGTTARQVNREDENPCRKVWFNYWDSQLTFQRSYPARLKYVHTNPVHHKLVSNAEDYPWCSASEFARSARKSFQRTVNSMPVDRIRIRDDF
jgi:putative transposase